MDSKQIREKAVNVIGTYLGEIVAKSYREFYSDKEISTVKLSLSELLTDYLGEKKAREILTKNGIN